MFHWIGHAKEKTSYADIQGASDLGDTQEEKTVAQIAAEHNIHPGQPGQPGQLYRWKRQALENFPHLFTESQTIRQQAQAHDGQVTALYAEIGELTTQLKRLKKIWP